jgi:hypothetical protein
MLRSLARTCQKPRSFPKRYFDLKAFRKGISEKKRSLLEAEKREVDRQFAKPAPEGWTVETFLEKAGIVNSSDENLIQRLAACFEDWNDLVSSTRKDLFRVSHMLSAEQVKKLSVAIELFNHGLFGLSNTEVEKSFPGKPLRNEAEPWTASEDEKLIELAVEKYDYKFGDVWLYVSAEMERPIDQVRDRFVEIYLKPMLAREEECEVILTKSYRPLLMNRQFRLLPPQCYVIPSDTHYRSETPEFTLSEPFQRYRNPSLFS